MVHNFSHGKSEFDGNNTRRAWQCWSLAGIPLVAGRVSVVAKPRDMGLMGSAR